MLIKEIPERNAIIRNEKDKSVGEVRSGKKCLLFGDLLRKVHRRLNASWKICSLAVNGQSFLVIDGYLLNS